MGRYEDSVAYHKMVDEAANKERMKRQEKIDALREQQEEYREKQDFKYGAMKAYNEFQTFTRDLLLKSIIENVMEAAQPLDENNTTMRMVRDNLLNQFMDEKHHTYNIMREAKYRNKDNSLYEDMDYAINHTYQRIMEEVDEEDPTTFKIDKDNVTNMLDSLDREDDFENVKQAIQLRVTNAEEDFVNNNLANKADIENIINQTAQRINDVNDDEKMSDETKEAITAEMTRRASATMQAIQESGSGLFNEMVTNLSRAVMRTPSLRESWTVDGGKLNMDAIVEAVKVNYTFLEAINLLGLEKVDENYIQNVLKEMAGDNYAQIKIRELRKKAEEV